MVFKSSALSVVALFCCAIATASQSTIKPGTSLSLLEQTEGLPDDFLEHFFDLPLTVRMEQDGKFLGEARVVLSRDNRVQLLDFIDVYDSRFSIAQRERWSELLSQPTPLGPCTQGCSNNLLAMHYSLENSVLSLVTRDAEIDQQQTRFHRLPEGGSHGLILRNQLNVYGGAGQGTAGRYAVDTQGSIGSWSTVGSYQVDRSGAEGAQSRQSVQNLYAQREHNEHFLRGGLFLPNFQGVTRQPSSPNAVPNTIVGLMFGTSDSLAIDSASPSLYPLYVTANRQGTVEIYRDGSLIYTQPVEPGLQLIDTKRLPGGIYEVEVRMIEDGRVTSTQTELINKPSHWRNPQERWRYSGFAGQQRNLLSRGDSENDHQDLAAGGVINYLAHPRAVLGAMVQQIGKERAFGSSLDWHASDSANVYTNLFHSSTHGVGLDVQAIHNYRTGSVMFNHSLNWQNADRYRGSRAGTQRTSALAINQRLNDRNSLSARVSHNNGVNSGAGFDLSFNQRSHLFGSEANWRTSVFDRPASLSSDNRRNRGVDLTLSLALGKDGRRYSVGAGSRTASQGGRDQYANASVYQDLDGSLLKSVNGTVTSDRYGAGLSAGAMFEHQALGGDVFVQRSSLEGDLSGGLNLESALVLGGGKMTAAGHAVSSGAHTGMIVDVDSDLPDLRLSAADSSGGRVELKPGRNFVPLTAYKPGTVQLDFVGAEAPAVVIQPATASYHLNKGGVVYHKVKVMQTLTVIGQLHDAAGAPLRGAHVRNHAGRSVVEADGFFTLEMSAREPMLEVSHPDVQGCAFSFDKHSFPREGDVLMVGTLQCRDTHNTTPLLTVITGNEEQS